MNINRKRLLISSLIWLFIGYIAGEINLVNISAVGLFIWLVTDDDKKA